MLLREFYNTVILSEEQCVEFLRENQLLVQAADHPPCARCGHVMEQKRKRDRGGEFRLVLRCPQRVCQTTRSVRQGNAFFHYTDINGCLNSQLPICGIVELVYMFTIDMPALRVVELTGKSRGTVVDWFNMCREVCTTIMRRRPQMLGTHTSPIQIDEARLAGGRKYNRGRILQGDHPPQERDADVAVENQRNHGNRVDGPWVFGLKQITDVRCFHVVRRDRNTLLPIIQRECAPGSVIHSDEWPAYATLNTLGFDHYNVNHQQAYVNQVTGAHTQAIERSWLDSKIRILKKMRGVPATTFRSHLDYCWCIAQEGEIFLEFLRDRAVYA